MATISTALVRATSVALIAFAICCVSGASAQSPERDAHMETCAALEATPLGFQAADFANRDTEPSRIQAYNFEAEVVDCPGRAFPTANGDLRPAYMSIAFSNDRLVANVTVETEPPTDSKPGDGYNCELARIGNHWLPQRCVRVTTLLFVDPPTPFAVP